MSEKFYRKDLANVNYDNIIDFNKYYPTIDHLSFGFSFTLKDGRKFYLAISHDFKVKLRCPKYGDYYVSLLQKFAADVVKNNTKFYSIIETTQRIMNVIPHYSADGMSFYDIMGGECLEILKQEYSPKELVMEYIKMGLDKNIRGVEIEFVSQES